MNTIPNTSTHKSTHKAVAIDTANFWATYRDLGIEEIDHRRLMGYLRHRIGSDMPILECKAAVRPELCHAGHRLFCDMKRAGIIPVPASPIDSKDDLAVKTWVCDFLKQPQVSEIILVSGDCDIVVQAVYFAKVCEKLGKLCQLFVLSTETPGRGGSTQIGQIALSAIQNFHMAKFVDVQSFLPQLASTKNRRH